MKAFPRADGKFDSSKPDEQGMTLRDYFAAKAMQGISATLIQTNGEPYWNVIATDSYKMADAMMKAREA